jgi:hypothetical protein
VILVGIVVSVFVVLDEVLGDDFTCTCCGSGLLLSPYMSCGRYCLWLSLHVVFVWQERFLMPNGVFPRWVTRPHGACSFHLKVVRRWMPLKADERCDLEVVIVANHIRVVNARMQGLTITPELKEEFSQFWAAHQATPFTARNKILASVCPQVRATFQMDTAPSYA